MSIFGWKGDRHNLSKGAFDSVSVVKPGNASLLLAEYMGQTFDESFVSLTKNYQKIISSDRVLGMLSSKTKRAKEGGEPVKEHLVVTRYAASRVGKGEMLSLDDINDILGIPLLGVIPESEKVLNASNSGMPVAMEDNADAGQAYLDLVARFLGENRPMRFTQAKKKFLDRLMGR